VIAKDFIDHCIACKDKDSCWTGFPARLYANGVQVSTPYYVYESIHGAVPPDRHIKRTCKTAGCCNPCHRKVVPGAARGRPRLDWTARPKSIPSRYASQPPLEPDGHVPTLVINTPDDLRIRPKGGARRCWRSPERRIMVNHVQVLIHRYAFEAYTGVALCGKHLLRTCDRDDCYNPHHYVIESPSPAPLPERELSKLREFTEYPGADGRLVMGHPDECWRWQGSHDPAGYGQIAVGRKTMKVHRFAWQQFMGPIPAGVNVVQTCHNRDCYNPSHLELVFCRNGFEFPQQFSGGKEFARWAARQRERQP
jgi:hypothetical protein